MTIQQPGESMYYQFIYDCDEIEWFYKYAVPRVEQDKVLFWSLSARNKILNEEERKYYMLGRSEMMKKSVIRKNGFSFFMESLRSVECHKHAMLTKSRVPYPQKCLRLYWNLNATSVRKVIFEQQRLINEYNEEMIAAALKKSDAAIESAFHKMRRIFDATLSLYARASAERMWCDFEIDMEADDLDKDSYHQFINLSRKFLTEKIKKGNFLIVTSPGGLHFPVKKTALTFNPQELINGLGGLANECRLSIIECIRNENEMIVLPGTYAYRADGSQASPVVLNKDDFSPGDEIKKEPE
ncbi:MAG: hypothetical protein FWB83_11800 [Treponema sp.]|nr:hypothetical protein [Treponema sp.]